MDIVQSRINKLHGVLQKEWHSINKSFSFKSDLEVFEDFRKQYNNFEDIDDFLAACSSNVVYNEWERWRPHYRWNEETLIVLFNKFKELWQYATNETKTMFNEMGLLSENMIREWRLKYEFVYTHVYEMYNCKYDDIVKKSKTQLWKEFKETWDIDIDSYDEDKYNNMASYVNKIECDTEDYFQRYPRNFFEFRENGNYHSFGNYSIIEQFDICEDWERYLLNSKRI